MTAPSDPARAAQPTAPHVLLLGGARLLVDGATLPLGRKVAGVLAYLHLQGPSPRGVVAALLWPDADATTARRNLRQRLFQLRTPAGFEPILGRQILALDPRVTCDLASTPIDLDAVPAELLAGFDYPECSAFGDWLDGARRRVREQQLEALLAAAVAHEAQGELGAAAALVQRLVEADPLSEHAHRRLMRLHYLRGDRSAAIASFARCAQLLEQELGTPPDAETLALLRTIETAGPAPRAPHGDALPAAVLRPPRLIGRDAELAMICTAWAAGQLVLVTGEGGAGKSRLVEAVVEGRRALVVRGRAGDPATPYALLARLLRGVVNGLDTPLPVELRGELARLLPDLGQVVPMRDRADQVRFMQALEATLARAADEGLALIVVDDLHAADAASCDALAALAGGESPLRWLLAARAGELEEAVSDALPGAAKGAANGTLRGVTAGVGRAVARGAGPKGRPEDESPNTQDEGSPVSPPGHPKGPFSSAQRGRNPASPLQALLQGTAGGPGCVTVALRPLSEDDIGSLLVSLQLPQLDAGTLAAPLARHAGGNPLFVLETVKQVLVGRVPALDAAQAPQLPVPERVQRIIEQRLARLSAPAVRLLRCAALAGQDFDALLAAEVLDCRPLDLADAWSELEAQQILKGNGFAHDLIATAALLSLPAPVSGAIHSEIAQCLQRRDAEPGRIAQHFAMAGQPGAAAPHWLAAGHAARAALRFAEATRFFEQAARAALADGARATAFEAAKAMRIAAFEIDLSDLSEAALALLDQAADTPADRAFALSERAVTLLHRGDLEGTQRHAREGLKVLGDADAPLVRIELRRNLAAVHTFRNETFAALAELRSVQHDVQTLAPPPLRFLFLQSLSIICDHADQWDEAQRLYETSVRLGLETGNVPGAAQTSLNLANGLHDRGQIKDALLALERARTLIATMPAGHPSYSSLDLNYGIVLRTRGDYAGALHHMERAVVSGAAQTPGWLPLIRANEAHLWLHLGQTARAHQALQAAVPVEATPMAAVAKWHGVHADVQSALRRPVPPLDGLIARLPAMGRAATRWRLQIKAMAYEPDVQQVWRDGQSVLQELRASARVSMVIHLGARLAEVAARVGQARAGAALAREVLAALEDHEPDDITRGHALLLCALALAAGAQRQLGEQVMGQAARWVRETAATRVPAAFRESFEVRYGPHRRVLEGSARRLPAE